LPEGHFRRCHHEKGAETSRASGSLGKLSRGERLRPDTPER
jgi:hypothetical protein